MYRGGSSGQSFIVTRMLLLRNEGSLEIALTLHHIVAGLVRHLKQNVHNVSKVLDSLPSELP